MGFKTNFKQIKMKSKIIWVLNLAKKGLLINFEKIKKCRKVRVMMIALQMSIHLKRENKKMEMVK
jgi:hypothetical protein